MGVDLRVALSLRSRRSRADVVPPEPVWDRGALQLESFAQPLVDLGLVVDRVHVADLEVRDEAAVIRGDRHLRHGTALLSSNADPSRAVFRPGFLQRPDRLSGYAAPPR
jgi:hypothetical protein